MKTQRLCFQVDGEWLTEFFRLRFWEENCGYENAIKLIRDSLSEDFPEEMCVELLEGRKKLVGVNSFDYMDDNEKIRPLQLYIKKQEDKLKIHAIIKDIETYPYNYIDQYSCTIGRYWINKQVGYDHKIEFWFDRLVYEKGDIFDVLNNGCLWLENLENTAKIITKYTDKTRLDWEEFAEIIYKEYEKTIEVWRDKQIPFKELSDYQQSIICRNRHYAMIKGSGKYDYLNEPVLNRFKYIENKKNNEELKKKFEKEQSKFEAANGQNSDNNILNSFFNINDFDTTPIKLSNIQAGWDGFVDKQGNFYQTKPIGSLYYNGSANCHRDWAIQYLKEQGINTDKDVKDYLIYDLGWCDYAHYVLLADHKVNVQKIKRFTKAQEKTLFKLFELNNDDWKYYQRIIEDIHDDL